MSKYTNYLETLVLSLVVMALVYACFDQLPKAIDRQLDFNEKVYRVKP